MAQAKKKTATKTAKKSTRTTTKKAAKKGICYEKYQRGQKSNTFFIISMTVLAATLLFANLLMIVGQFKTKTKICPRGRFFMQ